jgi:hypothetical protein
LWYVVVRYAVKPEKAGVWGLNKKVQGWERLQKVRG